ncbi:unnamed protein product [Polarella glacialis]|uniref:Uncharacterized protein n=1 Tax=Polarella glacialis TaxID=89957 RepID=A0A813LCQ2_POLGL|nr:unnamed protein product [Polarella glacialis]
MAKQQPAPRQSARILAEATAKAKAKATAKAAQAKAKAKAKAQAKPKAKAKAQAKPEPKAKADFWSDGQVATLLADKRADMLAVREDLGTTKAELAQTRDELAATKEELAKEKTKTNVAEAKLVTVKSTVRDFMDFLQDRFRPANPYEIYSPNLSPLPPPAPGWEDGQLPHA